MRIRRAGTKAYIAIKGKAVGPARPEYEYEIPPGEAEELLQSLCRRPLIEKTRHDVLYAGHLWRVDEFGGDNAGLVLAEVELGRADETFAHPPWLGDEVTLDPRYRNSMLSAEPLGRTHTRPRIG